jgi:Flp pilus assembly protein TadB
MDLFGGVPVPGLVVLACVFAAFGFLGWVLAPAIAKRVEESTAGYVKWMIETLDKMFLTISGRTCLYLIIASTIFWFFFGLWFTSGLPSGDGYFAFRTLIALIMCLGLFRLPTGYRMPRFVVNRMWENRLDRFGEQLIDALTFMSNGLRSGLSLVQSMDMVKEELHDPMSQEFALVLSQQRLGVPLEDALLSLERRIDTEDVQIMVTSINILRQSGGNLTETFDTIAHTIRERKKVEGKIKSMTAQGISQGVIIVLMPIVLAGILYMMDPELIRRLWTTWIGLVMVLFMLVLQILGALMIRKIVRIEV